MNFARTHRSNDPVGWDDVIEALLQILTHKDMKRIVTRSDENVVREGFERLDRDIYHTWKASFVGIDRYHAILHGVSGRFSHEEVLESATYPEDHDPEASDDDADLVSGHQYYLTYQMMSAYYQWLRLHPTEETIFMNGFMVSILCLVCFDKSP